MAKAQVKGHQRGDVLDYPNTTNAVIPAMTILQIGDIVGVAAGDIQPGETGGAYVSGVFLMPKATGSAAAAPAVASEGDSESSPKTDTGTTSSSAIAQGARLSFDGSVFAASTSGTAGYAFAAAEADAPFVAVKLNG